MRLWLRRLSHAPRCELCVLLVHGLPPRQKKKAPGSRHNDSPFTQHDRKHRMPAGKALPTACLVQVRGDWDWMSQAYRFRRANELQRGCCPIPTRPCVDACDSIGRSRKLLCALVVLINKCAAQALPPNRCTIKHQKKAAA